MASAARFRERSAKSGYKKAQPLLGEALEQVAKGWLLPPTPLASDGEPTAWKSTRYDVILASARFSPEGSEIATTWGIRWRTWLVLYTLRSSFLRGIASLLFHACYQLRVANGRHSMPIAKSLTNSFRLDPPTDGMRL